MEKNNTSMVAWVALIISILALILAWTAFNRAGADLEEMIEAQVEEAAMEIEEAAMEAEQAAQEAEREARDETADALEATADTIDGAATDARTDDDGPNN